jgi:hypothetical protein
VLLGLVCAATVAGTTIWMRRPEPVPTPILDHNPLADAGFILANRYTGEIRDPSSLEDLPSAIQQRGPQALAALESELAHVRQSPRPDPLLMARKKY